MVWTRKEREASENNKNLCLMIIADHASWKDHYDEDWKRWDRRNVDVDWFILVGSFSDESFIRWKMKINYITIFLYAFRSPRNTKEASVKQKSRNKKWSCLGEMFLISLIETPWYLSSWMENCILTFKRNGKVSFGIQFPVFITFIILFLFILKVSSTMTIFEERNKRSNDAGL